MLLLEQAHELLCDTIHCELYNFLRDQLSPGKKVRANKMTCLFNIFGLFEL